MNYASLCIAIFFVCYSSCFVIFPEDSVGSLPEQCARALSTNITACNNVVGALDTSESYTQHELDMACNATCASVLATWFNDVRNTCGNVTYVNDYGFQSQAFDIPGELYFNYNQTCLTISGQYCNLRIGNLTEMQNTNNNTNSSSAICNECDLLLLRNTAQSPYGNGPLVLSEGIYQSYTLSCGFTGYPLATSPVGSTSTSPNTASATLTAPGTMETCSGTTYHIKPGDTCNSISQSQGIATNWILLDNDLQAYCYNFPRNGSLCLSSFCSIYTVKAGETCNTVAKANNLTLTQLLSYNPWIDDGCYSFNSTIGTQICVNEPGQKYAAPPAVIAPGGPTTASTAAPVPTNIADNTTTNCGLYYLVQPGDACMSIASNFSLSMADFLILNPEIDPNCTNLYKDESYCVMPVGDINNYPGSPFYVDPNDNGTAPAFSSLPNATYSPYFSITPLSLAPGTKTNCTAYADGPSLQFNVSGVSDCAVAADIWGIQPNELHKWNPSLYEANDGNSSISGRYLNSSATCSFAPYYRYCMAWGKSLWTASIFTTNLTWTPGPKSTVNATSTWAPPTATPYGARPKPKTTGYNREVTNRPTQIVTASKQV